MNIEHVPASAVSVEALPKYLVDLRDAPPPPAVGPKRRARIEAYKRDIIELNALLIELEKYHVEATAAAVAAGVRHDVVVLMTKNARKLVRNVTEERNRLTSELETIDPESRA